MNYNDEMKNMYEIESFSFATAFPLIWGTSLIDFRHGSKEMPNFHVRHNHEVFKPQRSTPIIHL